MDKVSIELSKSFISDISKHKINHLYILRHNSQFSSFQFLMADLCDKDLYDLKILEALDYIEPVSKNKPSKEKGTEIYDWKQFKIAGRSSKDVT